MWSQHWPKISPVVNLFSFLLFVRTYVILDKIIRGHVDRDDTVTTVHTHPAKNGLV